MRLVALQLRALEIFLLIQLPIEACALLLQNSCWRSFRILRAKKSEHESGHCVSQCSASVLPYWAELSNRLSYWPTKISRVRRLLMVTLCWISYWQHEASLLLLKEWASRGKSQLGVTGNFPPLPYHTEDKVLTLLLLWFPCLMVEVKCKTY